MKKSALLLAVFFLFANTVDVFALHPIAKTNGKTSRSAFVNKNIAAKYRTLLLDRFLKYTTYNSQSSETEAITPEQIETAKKLYSELKSMGLNVKLTEHYYIFVDVPSNLAWDAPTLGFSCHYDVTPGIEAHDIRAIIHKNYDGKPIELGNNQVIDPAKDNGAYLPTQIGKTIVTSDGNTILSADDKAGVSIVVTFLQTLVQNPKKPHGHIQVVIAPNEDVGRAAEYVEETGYNPDIAFDFDGGVNGEVIVENFNARQVIYTVTGTPGHQSFAATNGYRNAWKPACKLGDEICSKEMLPNHSEGKKGYAELHHMYYPDGKVFVAELDIRLRGFDQKEMDKWEANSDSIAAIIAEEYDVQIARKTNNQYANVGEVCHPDALQVTQAAFAAAGVPLNTISERAGTTAAMFVTKNLIGAFTIFTGQNNPHAYTEWLSEEDMFKAYLVALNLADEVAKIRVTK